MKTLAQRKKSIDTQFAKWESRIKSLEKSFEDKAEGTVDHLHEKKVKLLSTMEKIDSRINHLSNLTEQKKNALLGKSDTLKLQLALGKADLKTNYEQNKKQFNEAMSNYDAELQTELDIEDDLLEKEWIEDSIAYEEEMNAVAIEMVKEDKEMSEKYEQRKRKLKESLHSFKVKVEEKNKKMKDGMKESIDDVAEEYAELGEYYFWY